jgi:tetratricopeptide (TPR) repeat protein
LWFGELGDEIKYLIDDIRSDLISTEDLCRLHSTQQSAGKGRDKVIEECEMTHGTADDLPPGSWQAWAESLSGVRQRKGNPEVLAVLTEAAEALRERPASLSRVLVLAMDRFPNTVAKAGLDELISSVLQAEQDPAATMLGFAWHAHRHEDDLAGGFAVRFLEHYKGVPDRLLKFQNRLARARYARRYLDQELLALDLVLKAESHHLDALQKKFELLHSKLEKPAAAMRVGRALVRARRGDPNFLNSFAWRLLTEEPFKGHMNPLALESVDAMRRLDNWRNYWRLDTVALALYENGQIEEAIKTQEEALAICEPGSQGRYAQRLERYRMAASAPVPAK